jgi:hypothetical protein
VSRENSASKVDSNDDINEFLTSIDIY